MKVILVVVALFCFVQQQSEAAVAKQPNYAPDELHEILLLAQGEFNEHYKSKNLVFFEEKVKHVEKLQLRNHRMKYIIKTKYQLTDCLKPVVIGKRCRYIGKAKNILIEAIVNINAESDRYLEKAKFTVDKQ